MKVTYIGPESAVDHTDAQCSALRARHRYYPSHTVTGRHAASIVARRRLCAKCAARSPQP